MTVADITPLPGEFVFGMEHNDATRLLVGTAMLDSHVKQGKSFRSISLEWGTSHHTVSKYVNRALDEYAEVNVGEAKRLVLEQIDDMIETWRPKAKNSTQNADVLGRWIDRKIKLLGLDSPIKIHQTTVEVSKDEQELMALIEQTRHEEAMRLEAMKNANNNT